MYWPWLRWASIFESLALIEFIYRSVGLLFIFPLIYATILYGWRGVATVWSIHLLTVVIRLSNLHLSSDFIVRSIFLISIPIVIVAIMAIINYQTKWRKSLKQRESERRNYLAQVLKSQEDERRRIARELHDDTIQRLLVSANSAQSLISGRDDDEGSDIDRKAKLIKEELLMVCQDLRRLSQDLRPHVLDTMGLVSSIVWILDKLEKQEGLQTSLQVTGTQRRLSPAHEIAIFRIVQEALNNARRHAHATQITVHLNFSTDSLGIIVRDNGRGFILDAFDGTLNNSQKMGITGMRERAGFLDGNLNIQSVPGAGTTIELIAKCC